MSRGCLVNRDSMLVPSTETSRIKADGWTALPKSPSWICNVVVVWGLVQKRISTSSSRIITLVYMYKCCNSFMNTLLNENTGIAEPKYWFTWAQSRVFMTNSMSGNWSLIFLKKCSTPEHLEGKRQSLSLYSLCPMIWYFVPLNNKALRKFTLIVGFLQQLKLILYFSLAFSIISLVMPSLKGNKSLAIRSVKQEQFLDLQGT